MLGAARVASSSLRLNRPEARNALTWSADRRASGAAVADAEADPEIRAVVLTGTGDRAFCAGMDLRAFAGGDVAVGRATSAAIAGAYMRLLEGEVAIPVVGAANATAVAGGFELLLGCDVIVASADAKFGLPEVKRGLFAAGGGTFTRHAASRSASRWSCALTGDSIDAARAYELGLVNAVVPPDEVLDDRARGRRSGSPPTARSALAATKELVRLGVDRPARAPRSGSTSGSRRLRQRGRQGRRDARSSRSVRPVWQGR